MSRNVSGTENSKHTFCNHHGTSPSGAWYSNYGPTGEFNTSLLLCDQQRVVHFQICDSYFPGHGILTTYLRVSSILYCYFAIKKQLYIFKTATVIPLLKPRHSKRVNNCRHLVLTTVTNKIHGSTSNIYRVTFLYEQYLDTKSIFKRKLPLTKFLNTLTKFVLILKTSLNVQNLLDLANAFDILNYSLSLQKLDFYYVSTATVDVLNWKEHRITILFVGGKCELCK